MTRFETEVVLSEMIMLDTKGEVEQPAPEPTPPPPPTSRRSSGTRVSAEDVL